MTTLSKILRKWIPGDLHSLSWLEKNGVSQSLAYSYYKSGHLEKLGPGIYKRKGDTLHWQAGIRLLQEELNKKIHIASHTALGYSRVIHYISMQERPTIQIWSYEHTVIPSWFKNIDFECNFQWKSSSLFELEEHLIKIEEPKNISFWVSCRELAILEFLHVMELRYSFEDAFNYIETLGTLMPNIVQELLEKCRSIRTKRVFLYLSEQLEHPYMNELNLSKINLGSGKRKIIQNGVLNKKYQITVPPTPAESQF